MRAGEAHSRHPRVLRVALLDPLPGGVDLQRGAVAACSRIGIGYFGYFALRIIDDQRRHVVRVGHVEVERLRRRRAARAALVEEASFRNALEPLAKAGQLLASATRIAADTRRGCADNAA